MGFGPNVGQQTGAVGTNSVNDAFVAGSNATGAAAGVPLPAGQIPPAGSGATPYVLPGISNSAPIYNIGMPRDAYFFSHSSAATLSDTGSLPNQTSNNAPTTVSAVEDLWVKAGGHKGMIVRYIDHQAPASFVGALPSGFSPDNSSVVRYGFQFHYNPSSLSMTYDGTSNVDPYFEAAGADIANPAGGVGMSQSSLALEVFLNRRFDFKYYDNAGHLKPNSPSNLYAPRMPSIAEQEEIYNKGTMYDIEFLIGTLVGFKARSRLRGLTTDLGFLIGYPVEIHLSKYMRYFGTVTSITVNHGQFDQRMVPIQSTVAIQFSRLPDFA